MSADTTGMQGLTSPKLTHRAFYLSRGILMPLMLKETHRAAHVRLTFRAYPQ